MESLSFDASELRSSNVSRRTILKGVAWSVPAVMVAQVPSWAQTTGTPDITIDFGDSTACKIPGNSVGKDFCYNKGYVLWASIVNSTPDDVTILGLANGTSMIVGGVPQCFVGIADPKDLCVPEPAASSGVEVPAGASYHVAFFSDADSESSSTTVSLALRYQIDGGPIEETPLLSGNVTGSPWTNGVGSCKFPPNACGGQSGKDNNPIMACGVTGPNC